MVSFSLFVVVFLSSWACLFCCCCIFFVCVWVSGFKKIGSLRTYTAQASGGGGGGNHFSSSFEIIVVTFDLEGWNRRIWRGVKKESHRKQSVERRPSGPADEFNRLGSTIYVHRVFLFLSFFFFFLFKINKYCTVHSCGVFMCIQHSQFTVEKDEAAKTKIIDNHR